MRLQRLDLTRYGIFTGHSIDFGDRRSGTPDLHVIYGANEAGKSTALAAFLDLLFGIEPRSRFNFKHPYEAMQIGAALDLGGTVHELVRVKKAQMSLLDANGQPLDEGAIAGELGNIDRDAYRTLFSLDDDTLEEGGENILASKGDVGQLLFSASTGLAGLSRSLGELQEEVDGFYRPRGRNTELAQLKSQLGELQSQKTQLDTKAATYVRLIEARNTAQKAYEEVSDAKSAAKARLDELQRRLTGLPMLAGLQKVEDELGRLGDLPEPPAEWSGEIRELMDQDTRLSTQLQGIKGEVQRIKDELDAIVLDEAIDEIADRIDSLTAAEARYRTAEDIPSRQIELDRVNSEIEGIFRRLEQAPDTDPGQLTLPASTVGVFQDLIERRSGIETRLDNAKTEHARAKERLNDARAEVVAMDDEIGAEELNRNKVEILAATVKAVQDSDHLVRLRFAEDTRSKHQTELAEHLRRLQPWQGHVEMLADLSVPTSNQIHAWQSAIDRIEGLIEQYDQEIERLNRDREVQEAEVNAIKRSAHMVDDDEAKAMRDERNRAWDEHRAKLDDETANRFEEFLRRDDELTDARLHHASQIARLRETEISTAKLKAGIEGATKRREAAAAELRSVRDEVGAAIEAITGTERLPVDMPIAELADWLQRREIALQSWRAVKAADHDIDTAKIDGTSARTRLAASLSDAGIDHKTDVTFGSLVDTARAAIDRHQAQQHKLESIRSQMAECERQLKDRARALADAREADETWNRDWKDMINGSWLGSRADTPRTGSVREILKEVAALGPAVDKRTGLVDRINKMRADSDAFVKEMVALGEVIGETVSKERVLETAVRLRARLEKLRRQKEKQQSRSDDLEEAEARQRAVTGDLQLHQERKTQMTAFFGVTTLQEVSDRLEQIRRRADLHQRKSDLQEQIIKTMRCRSVEEARRALMEAEVLELENEATQLSARIEDFDERARDLFVQHSKAEDEIQAVGGDASVAKIDEQRETILLEIEDKALKHLRLKVGIAAAELALRAYRDTHRSSMMVHASDAFQTISRGAYTGLTTRVNKDTEVLIGMTAGGGSKLAAEMSKGTRFQLYLALRVAGFYEYLRLRSALPFLADDILETFDDFRAEETFRLFSEMAGHGQVIYLTHHRHLCDIARDVCPSVVVHDLPSPQLQPQDKASAAS